MKLKSNWTDQGFFKKTKVKNWAMRDRRSLPRNKVVKIALVRQIKGRFHMQGITFDSFQDVMNEARRNGFNRVEMGCVKKVIES